MSELSKPFALNCVFVDACLPDYWGGHHEPHISVPVYKGMPLIDLKEELTRELCHGCVCGSGDQSIYESEAWHNAALQSIQEVSLINPLAKTCFNDLDASTLAPDNDVCVQAYFIFRSK